MSSIVLRMTERLGSMPALYSCENVELEDKLVHIVFYTIDGDSCWLGTEYDPEEQIFFGWAVINADLQMAEWGYFSLEELKGIARRGLLRVACDFKPVPFGLFDDYFAERNDGTDLITLLQDNPRREITSLSPRAQTDFPSAPSAPPDAAPSMPAERLAASA